MGQPKNNYPRVIFSKNILTKLIRRAYSISHQTHNILSTEKNLNDSYYG